MGDGRLPHAWGAGALAATLPGLHGGAGEGKEQPGGAGRGLSGSAARHAESALARSCAYRAPALPALPSACRRGTARAAEAPTRPDECQRGRDAGRVPGHRAPARPPRLRRFLPTDLSDGAALERWWGGPDTCQAYAVSDSRCRITV